LPGTTTFTYKAVEFAAAKRIIHDNQFQAMTLASNFGELDDPFIWLRSYWHSKGANQLANYSNPQYDAIVDQLVGTSDHQPAVTLGKQALDMLYQDLPAIPSGLWGDELSALKTYVKGSGFKDKKNDGHSAFRQDATFLDK
jgi:ABC-type transport system substrate-binding protein